MSRSPLRLVASNDHPIATKPASKVPSRAELAEPLDDVEEMALHEYVLQMEEASARYVRQVSASGRHVSRALAVLSVASLEASSAFAVVVEEAGGPRIDPSRIVQAAGVVARDMHEDIEAEAPMPSM
ncbi:hypothetical protein [Bosea sp. RAC05]|uniref:hypothetical protein n=1 Tax=Bosea sp. RAC05 TaxID=1842539 RepID=UPI000856758B|nr:hypothetical protein [Bosea sp. RAC05]AOG03122.1 hypothetical protein BSY19_5198 [Bosea sp. RAC05]